MRRNKKSPALVWAGMLICLCFAWQTQVRAAAGSIYSCTVNACYSHPVTGVIEDSGGEASYATGQGMVAGVVNSAGMLEVTSEGAYYLTCRFSLMDYTSGHEFKVQKTNDSGWTDAAFTVTGNGSDQNGTTADIRIQVPSQDCVVRGSMYVNPMGRTVIFYFYPNQFAEGKPEGMTAQMVTETDTSAGTVSDAGTAADTSESASAGTASGTGTAADTSESASAGTASGAGTAADTSESASAGTASGAGTAADTSANASAGTASGAETGTSDDGLNSAQGLSLSTAEGIEPEAESGAQKSSDFTLGGLIAVCTVSFTLSGLLLLAAAAGVAYWFRRNWKRWGGEDDEEE